MVSREQEEQRRAIFEYAEELPGEKKEVACLFLEADSTMVHLQREEQKLGEVKLGLSYEGWEKRTPGSNEYTLINPMVNCGVFPDSDAFWDDPISDLIACFTAVGSAFAGVVTYGWKLFFGATHSLTRGDATVNKFVYSFALLLIVYVAQNAFKVLSKLYQPKFMEEVKFSILGEIHEKVDAIPAEYYEDPSLYDTIHRANDIVSSGRFMRFFLNGIAAVQEIITVVSVSLVLASFSLWLIPLCFVSVLPSFAARVVRGTRYYYMKVYQTPRTCYATGTRFLTVWQNFSGAWRIYII